MQKWVYLPGTRYDTLKVKTHCAEGQIVKGLLSLKNLTTKPWGSGCGHGWGLKCVMSDEAHFV